MATENSFLTYILDEVFHDIPGITAGRMFGGYGLYKEGKIFGMINDDILYFKVGEQNKKMYADAGSEPFTYQHKSGKEVAMSYYEVPEHILENKDELTSWITASLQVKR